MGVQEPFMRIYIGSTLSDLAPHREAIIDAIKGVQLRLGDIEIVSPQEMPASVPILEDELKIVAQANLYILVLGWRYGYIPEGHTKSLVELEYDTAREYKRPTLCFMVAERAPVPGNLVETGENAAALRRFKARLLSENLVRRFTFPAELGGYVATAVTSWMSRRIGEVNQDVIDHPILLDELAIVRVEQDKNLRLISELRDRLNDIVPATPIWHSRSFIVDTTLCFCLLPFQEPFFQIYEEGMVPAVEAAGLRATHAGQIFGNGEIMEDIWESICAARIVIADVTDRNPNVFYELGICHTLGKEVIVLTQRPEDVPFDFRHRRYIQYTRDKMTTLRSRLQQTIQRVLLRTSTSDDPGA
jgi:hypothetical protein